MIQVFVKRKEGSLVFQIADNGVGMTEERLSQVWTQEQRSKKEHLTGIGILNVDDRLKLLYGEDYGVRLESEEGKGTRVTVTVPAQAGEL